MIWEELQGELEALQRDGLRRQRRTLELPCGPQARVDGRELISFCSNDYLGLANDPALIEAAVSYTHLDVYKRQGQPCASGGPRGLGDKLRNRRLA